jgi:hypothetical protein
MKNKERKRIESFIKEDEKNKVRIYKNPNKDIKQKVKDFNLDKTFHINTYGNSTILEDIGEGETMCRNDRGRFIVKNEFLEKEIEREKRLSLLKKYPITPILNKLFSNGIPYNDGFSMVNINESMNEKTGDIKTYCSLTGYEMISEISSERHRIGDASFEINKLKDKIISFFDAKYSDDGNISIDVSDLDIDANILRGMNSKDDMAKEFMKYVPKDIKKLKYYGNKWFDLSSGKGFILYELDKRKEDIFNLISFDCFDVNNSGEYNINYTGKKKIPKTAKEVSVNHMIYTVLNKINESVDMGDNINIYDYVNGDLEIEKDVAKKRKQKTKLNFQEYNTIISFNNIETNSSIQKQIEEVSKNNNLIVLENINIPKNILKATKDIFNSINLADNEEKVVEYITQTIEYADFIPSYSFEKGEKQLDNSNYKALVIMPNDCMFTFGVEEGEAIEITNSHSIYATNIVDLKLVM